MTKLDWKMYTKEGEFGHTSFGSKFFPIRNLLWATTWLKVSGLLEPQMAQPYRIARLT